jgi:hypothetical protein
MRKPTKLKKTKQIENNKTLFESSSSETRTFSIRLPSDVYLELKERAENMDRSVGYYIRSLISKDLGI